MANRILTLSLTLSAMVLVGTPVRAADDNPEYNGLRLDKWDAMLRGELQNPRLRRVALVSMGQIASDHSANQKVVKPVMTAVGRTLKQDSVPSVRKQAAEVIGAMAVKLLDDKTADTNSVLLDLGENLRVEKESDVRREVAVALGRFGKDAKGAVAALTTVLADNDAATRAAAADTLGRIGLGASGAADALIALLKETDSTVRGAAIFALGRIEPDEPSKVAAALLPLVKGETVVELRRAVLTSLGLLADRSPATVMGTAAGLQDADVEVRRQAAQAMGKYVGGGKLAEKELKKAFEEDKDKQVRGAALRALCEGFGPDAKVLIPVIVARLKIEPEFDVRIAIIEELGALGAEGKDAIPALREAQRDAQTKVREAATAAIKRISAPKQKT